MWVSWYWSALIALACSLLKSPSLGSVCDPAHGASQSSVGRARTRLLSVPVAWIVFAFHASCYDPKNRVYVENTTSPASSADLL
jgi:hypothetical protein